MTGIITSCRPFCAVRTWLQFGQSCCNRNLCKSVSPSCILLSLVTFSFCFSFAKSSSNALSDSFINACADSTAFSREGSLAKGKGGREWSTNPGNWIRQEKQHNLVARRGVNYIQKRKAKGNRHQKKTHIRGFIATYIWLKGSLSFLQSPLFSFTKLL